MTWLRLYADLPDHPEIQSLPAEIFRTLINCWCIAAGGGGRLPDVAVLAWRIRMPAHPLSHHLEELQRVGLLTKETDGLAVKNWAKRQFVSDTSTPRVQRYRESKRAKQESTSNPVSPETERNVSPETVGNAPEQNRTEQNRAETPCSPPVGDEQEAQENRPPKAASKPEREVSIPHRLRQMASWFNRRTTTPYVEKELKAYRAMGNLDDEDFALLERYYRAPWQPGETYRRKSLVTLLNNWYSELDCARDWYRQTSPVGPVSDELELVL